MKVGPELAPTKVGAVEPGYPRTDTSTSTNTSSASVSALLLLLILLLVCTYIQYGDPLLRR